MTSLLSQQKYGEQNRPGRIKQQACGDVTVKSAPTGVGDGWKY